MDTPAEAVAAARTLIWDVMRDRGYPTDDRDASMDALSFYHARSLESYRQTRGLRTESATTEQLREAMISYRALFEDLTGLRKVTASPSVTAWRRSATAPPTATVPGRTATVPAPTAASPVLTAASQVRTTTWPRRTAPGPRTRPGRHSHAR